MLRCGNAHIELFKFSKPEPAPMAVDRPVHDHLGPKCRTTYGRDPDGNVIEFQELFESARW